MAARIYSRSEHPISRREVDADALKILYRLIRHDFKAYLVGGGVRDLLLRKKPKDFDIATDATPRQIKGLFRNSRIIGRRFRLIHVFFQGNKIIEVATFRAAESPIEHDEDGPIQTDENVFGTDASDAQRRDITINGLFYDLATFSIIDYVGGYEDLKAGIIRIIGDPDTRLKEDPVRLMRVVRHAARADFTIDPKCRESLKRNAHLLATSSPVRVYVELSRDLCSGFLLSILRLLHENGILAPMLPQLAERAHLLESASGLAQALYRFDEAVRNGAVPTVTQALAMLFLFSNSPAERADDLFEHFENLEDLDQALLKGFPSLAVPRKERERISFLISSWLELHHPETREQRIKSLTRKSGFMELKEFCSYMHGQGHPIVEALAPATPAPRERKRTRGGTSRGGR